MQLVGLVGISTALALAVLPRARSALVVVGIVAVVLLHRVNRAGWLATAGTHPDPATP